MDKTAKSLMLFITKVVFDTDCQDIYALSAKLFL